MEHKEHIKGEDIYIGDYYFNLTVVDIVYTTKNKNVGYVICDCKCGNKNLKYYISYFKLHHDRSCGCLPPNATKINLSNSRISNIWKSMRYRCNNKNKKLYGAYGITVCEEWDNKKSGFVAFYNWSINNGYKENLTIDRIDETKGYSPDNCRWASYEIQNTHLSMLKTNTTGYKGVIKINKFNKYIVIISIGNKTHRIGSYFTKEEAVNARNNYIDKNKLHHKKQEYIGENGYQYLY